MYTFRNFLKLQKNNFFNSNKKLINNRNYINWNNKMKECCIENYQSNPDFNIRIIFKKCQSIQYVDDLVMRSSMMI